MSGDSPASGFALDLEVYKVGGAVRDLLLDYPSQETDWVVVGATSADMLSRGFRQVGKDFPVFLHPASQEEYALARTERKSGHGYHGFALHADPSVTLEQDLTRRDLSINAMAMDAAGTIIDPHHGQADLRSRVLRHVSPAFTEDPLRVFRVARFAARYHHLGFTVAPETLALMSEIVHQGELEYLSPERIWTETERALAGPDPAIYFQTLQRCDALAPIFPGVEDALWLLERVTPLVSGPRQRWGALMATVPMLQLEHIASSLKLPKSYSEFARHLAGWLRQVDLQSPASIHEAITGLKVARKPTLLDDFAQTLAALDGVPTDQHALGTFLLAARSALLGVTSAPFIAQGIEGPALGAAIKAEQIARLAQLMQIHDLRQINVAGPSQGATTHH